MYRYYIGLDPGTNTGYAVYDRSIKQMTVVKTVKIHQAMTAVLSLFKQCNEFEMLVVVEDARQVEYYIHEDKLEGTASVNRDSQIWHDYLTEHKIPFMMVRPNPKITKLPARVVRAASGWTEPTNEHNRDAVMLVTGVSYTPEQVAEHAEKLAKTIEKKKATAARKRAAKKAIKIKRNNLTS